MYQKIEAIKRLRQLVSNVRDEAFENGQSSAKVGTENPINDYRVGGLKECKELIEAIHPLMQEPTIKLETKISEMITKYRREIQEHHYRIEHCEKMIDALRIVSEIL